MLVQRSRMAHIFDTARGLGPFDELPIAQIEADPQVMLSRNDRTQPFFLICAKDNVLAQMSGTATIELRYSNLRWQRMEPGDLLYIPAGTPHRIRVQEDSVHLRYKAQNPGLEGVSWFCQQCDAEIWRYEFDADAQPAQHGYLDGCTQFNADTHRRTCSCGEVTDPVDLSDYRWAQIAQELQTEFKQSGSGVEA